MTASGAAGVQVAEAIWQLQRPLGHKLQKKYQQLQRLLGASCRECLHNTCTHGIQTCPFRYVASNEHGGGGSQTDHDENQVGKTTQGLVLPKSLHQCGEILLRVWPAHGQNGGLVRVSEELANLLQAARASRSVAVSIDAHSRCQWQSKLSTAIMLMLNELHVRCRASNQC